MEAYWSDGRGRFDTADSYDNYPKFLNRKDYVVYTSSDGLWNYWVKGRDIELLRYNGNEIHVEIPTVIDDRIVTSLSYTFDGFYELKSVKIPDGVISLEWAFYGCEGLEEVR